ncbi:MAG: HAD-IIA family hydrolase [Ignavibacteria bacterium]|nr:HAD-IIA family hydrolase [Ignavibacteria bacterium]MDH7527222.1 HAD-IIA family hydrolase [Ignavibacteria bacterium]
MHEILQRFNGFIFDLDGTIYRETKLIDGAKEVFQKLNALKKKYVFVSNRTTSTKTQYKERLNSFGIDCDENQIITSAEVTKNYLIKNHKDENVFVIGEPIFIDYLKSSGIKIANHKIDIVLITLDRTLSFDKIYQAQKALQSGARFFAANADLTCPIEDDEILDAGYTITALENLTGKKLEINFGKPSKFIIKEVLKRISLQEQECILIGDRLETDILMAKQNQISSALVLSGVTKKEQLSISPINPDYILNSIADLIKE